VTLTEQCVLKVATLNGVLKRRWYPYRKCILSEHARYLPVIYKMVTIFWVLEMFETAQ
jgi:hypothetical protein